MSQGIRGPRLVLSLYLALVAVATVAGLLVGLTVPGLTSPALLGLLSLPATPLGFALYGGLTVATMLGVPLSLVVYVSRRVVDET